MITKIFKTAQNSAKLILLLVLISIFIISCSKEEPSKAKTLYRLDNEHLVFDNHNALLLVIKELKKGDLKLDDRFISLNNFYRSVSDDEIILAEELRKKENAVFFLHDNSVFGVVETGTPLSRLINYKGILQIGDSIYHVKKNETVIKHYKDFASNDVSKSRILSIKRSYLENLRSDLDHCTSFHHTTN